MTLLQAIDIRRSRRKYFPEPLEAKVIEKLQSLIAEYNQQKGFRIELVLDNGDAFDGLSKSYGMFSGVRHYIGLIANTNDSTSAERLGYYGELLVLHATALGLGSCWVAGSYSPKDCPFTLADGEKVICVITIGRVAQAESMRERFIRGIAHRKSKSAEDMYTADGAVPDWFSAGMLAVQKAPSAVNRQPVMFEYKDGKVSASVDKYDSPMMGLDFGIAKAHFELGAGGGTWQWGNGGGFTRYKA